MTLATLIWGMGFVGTRWTFAAFDPLWSNAIRFILAGSIAFPFLFLRWKKLPWLKGIQASALLFCGLHFQTAGIAQTTLAKSGFLTVFYAIFTPVLIALIARKKFRYTYWLLLLSAMLGIALLCDLKLENFNNGDFLVLLSAFFFSLHILLIDRYSTTINAIEFNFLQCFLMGWIGIIYALSTSQWPDVTQLWKNYKLLSPHPLNGFIILSTLSSLLAFSIQVSAQKLLKAHIVSLIFLLESVFAAFFGYIFFNETLSSRAIIGCFIVLVSVALTPWASKSRI